MLSSDALPEHLMTLCLDVLHSVALDERDLVHIMIEIVYDLCDPEEPVQGQSMELKNVLRCLTLCRGTLERVQGVCKSQRRWISLTKSLDFGPEHITGRHYGHTDSTVCSQHEYSNQEGSSHFVWSLLSSLRGKGCTSLPAL